MKAGRGKGKTSRTTRPADPFGGLLGHRLPVLPAAAACTVVVAGCKVTTGRQVQQLLVDVAPDAEPDDLAAAEARRLADEMRKAAKRARDKAYREANKDRAKAWRLANPERMAKYRRTWLERNRESALQQMAEWKRQQYHANPEKARAYARDRYHAKHQRSAAAKGDEAQP